MLHTLRTTAATIIARGKSVKYRHFTPSANAPRHVGARADLARGEVVKYRRITPSSERSGALGAVRSGALAVAIRVVLAALMAGVLAAVGLVALGAPAQADDSLATAWSPVETVASGPISNVRLAVSADGSTAIAVWILDDNGGNQTHAATATIDGNVASWGDPYLLSTDGVHTEAPAVAMSADGTRATVAWNRTNPQIVQSKTAIIAGKTANWDSQPIYEHADGGNLTPTVSLAMSADGTTVVAAWTNDGSPAYIATQSARIDSSGATWEANPHAVSPNYPSGEAFATISARGDIAAVGWHGITASSSGSYVIQALAGSITNGVSTWDGNTSVLSAPGTFSGQPQIELSDNGSRATAVWYRGNQGVIQTASATLVGTTATWGSSVIDLSTAGANSNPRLGLSADGAAATVVWSNRAGGNVFTVQSKSGVIAGNSSTWGPAVTTLTPSGSQGYDPKVGVSNDGKGAIAIWQRRNGGIDSVSANISGVSATWEQTPTDVSRSDEGDTPALATAVDGSHATAVWDGGESAKSASMKRTYTVTFNSNGGSGSMAPQSANSPTALESNAFTRNADTFSGWNTQADGGGTAYANGSTYSFRGNRTMYAQWNITQVPLGSCVKDAKMPAVPERGTRALTGRQCKTNAGQRVGTHLEVKSPRGDVRSPRLVCKVGQRTKSTRATGYGDGSRYCANGRLVVRTYGSQVRITVRWSAPAKPGYTAFKSTRTYRT